MSDARHPLSEDERCALVARLRAVPLWEKTANLQAFAAALTADATACADPLQIARMRQQVESLIADEPLTQLHRVLVDLEHNLNERCSRQMQQKANS